MKIDRADKDPERQGCNQTIRHTSYPKSAATWLLIDNNTYLALIWKDGQPQLEHAYALFTKGYITGTINEVSGSLDNNKLTLSAQVAGKYGDFSVSIDGTVCGDRVSSTVTKGDKKTTSLVVFYLRIAPGVVT